MRPRVAVYAHAIVPSNGPSLFVMTQVAAVQMVSGPEVAANLADAKRLIEHAAESGARLVVLPENFALMPRAEADRWQAAENDGDGPIQEFIAATARVHGIWLVAGTIPLRASAGKRVRAACLVYDDGGKRVGRYDKMHLFDVQLDHGERYHESAWFEAGDTPVVVPTPFGRLGLAVCYDLRFPELFRRLLDDGAELFALPSAFTVRTGRDHWEVLVRARAVENLAYVIAPGQGGRHANGRETYGDSMIVSPWGDILERRAHGPGIVLADCDLERLRAIRTQLPSIQHRRIRE